MKFLLVNIQAEGRQIIIYARGEDNKKYRIRVNDFYPYFYSTRIPQSRHVVRIEKGFKTLFGDEVYKIYVDHPGNIPKLRKPEDYEADIPYVRRFMVDARIKDYFIIPDDRLIEENGEIVVKTKDIIPIGD